MTIVGDMDAQRDGCWQRFTACSTPACALLGAAVLSACAGNDAATTEPNTDPVRSEVSAIDTDAVPESTDTLQTNAEAEFRNQIGPRAIDVDHPVMMVVDSIVPGDDILVRLRVANGSDQPVAVGGEDISYGPLLVIRDNGGNTYPARAVEPAGVDGLSIGHFDLRIDGPLEPGATELTFELATNRGPLTTGAVAVPDGAAVRWWSESPPMTFSDVAADDGTRTVRVRGIEDRGTHIDVSIEAVDSSAGFSMPDDAGATLTLADGTEFESLPHTLSTQEPDEMAGAVRFVGSLPPDPTPLSLAIAGIVIEIPAAEPPPDADAVVARLPELPDLIDAKIKVEPLPTGS